MDLILSWDSYSWIKYTSGLIKKNPKNYELLLVTKDCWDQVIFCKSFLCQEALYEQRKDDVFRVAKKLGLRKVYNLGYFYIEVEKLIAQLQLKFLFTKYNKIYYQDVFILSEVIKRLIQNTPCLKFGMLKKGFIIDEKVYLSDQEVESKLSLAKMISGAKDYDDITLYPVVETFFRSN